MFRVVGNSRADNRTLIINRPNFVGAPVESSIRALCRVPAWHSKSVPEQFSATAIESKSAPGSGCVRAANRSSEIPRVIGNGPQSQNTTPSPVVPPVHNPQVGAPVQTPTQHYNDNNDNRRFVSPKMQEQQTPRGITRNPSEQGNTTTEEHSIGSPAVNHSSPPVVPATHPQNNYGAPRNESRNNDTRSNQSQTSGQGDSIA